jgi:hypothetical protein
VSAFFSSWFFTPAFSVVFPAVLLVLAALLFFLVDLFLWAVPFLASVPLMLDLDVEASSAMAVLHAASVLCRLSADPRNKFPPTPQSSQFTFGLPNELLPFLMENLSLLPYAFDKNRQLPMLLAFKAPK